jgi:hypothetical protein
MFAVGIILVNDNSRQLPLKQSGGWKFNFSHHHPPPQYNPYLATSNYHILGPLKEGLRRRSASNDAAKDAMPSSLRSQRKTFFADGVRSLVKYTLKKGGNCVEKWCILHLSQTVVHEIVNRLISFLIQRRRISLSGLHYKAVYAWYEVHNYADGLLLNDSRQATSIAVIAIWSRFICG